MRIRKIANNVARFSRTEGRIVEPNFDEVSVEAAIGFARPNPATRNPRAVAGSSGDACLRDGRTTVHVNRLRTAAPGKHRDVVVRADEARSRRVRGHIPVSSANTTLARLV